MKRVDRFVVAVALATAVVASPGCHGACVYSPCALPFALRVSVTSSASGDPINNAVLVITGAVTTIQQCSGTCLVAGSAGTYQLSVSAPGFQGAERTVVVSGTPPQECGCIGVKTEQVAVSLAPATP